MPINERQMALGVATLLIDDAGANHIKQCLLLNIVKIFHKFHTQLLITRVHDILRPLDSRYAETQPADL